MTLMATLAVMSYLRFNGDGSDLYLIMHIDGYLICYLCLLSKKGDGYDNFTADSTQVMVSHLEEHRAAGHRVPDFDEVVAELWADDAENFG